MFFLRLRVKSCYSLLELHRSRKKACKMQDKRRKYITDTPSDIEKEPFFIDTSSQCSPMKEERFLHYHVLRNKKRRPVPATLHAKELIFFTQVSEPILHSAPGPAASFHSVARKRFKKTKHSFAARYNLNSVRFLLYLVRLSSS